MSSNKRRDSAPLIPSDTFNVCLVDNLSLEMICSMYTRKDVRPNVAKPIAYRLDKFLHHLKVVHHMSLIEYCRRYGLYDWPKCPLKGTDVGFVVTGKGIRLSTYAKGAIDTSLPAHQAHYERMRKDRLGEGNPMYGAKAWNDGLTAATDPRMADVARKLSEQPFSPERSEWSKRNYWKNCVGKFHHKMPHSDETKELCRRNTARLWSEGVFKRTSSIHLKMREYLATLPLKARLLEEYQVTWFSMDFAFPNHKIAIEVQGSYYHVDPRMYPNGPETAMQRRNWGRDIAKRKVCCDQEGWIIIEAWEPEINDGSFKQDILCKLKQYGLLD